MSFLHYFHSAISNHLSILFPMSPDITGLMVIVKQFDTSTVMVLRFQTDVPGWTVQIPEEEIRCVFDDIC